MIRSRHLGFAAILLFSSITSMAAPAPSPALVPAQATRVLPSVTCSYSTSLSQDRRVTYFRDCADAPEMVAFRGGIFRMGDANGTGRSYEQPVHEVTLAPFSIGRYEITRGEWHACVIAHACTEPYKTPIGAETGDRYPVSAVSWMQAKDYVAWLAKRTGRAYRLPSESEWEYAARAGARGKYGWSMGEADVVTCQHANILDRSAVARHPELNWPADCDDGFPETAPVGSFPPNDWGVYDMQGNVWEWVEDCWHSDYAGAPTDGSAWLRGGDCTKHVNRGGGWGNGRETLRLSNRDADPAGSYSDGLGFRVAFSHPVPKSP